jgi:hypothetical protein
MIKCGNCKDRHETVAEVKSCYVSTKAKVLDAKVATLQTEIKTEQIKTELIKSQPVTEAGIYRKVINAKTGTITCIYRVKIGKSGYPYAEALVLGAPGQKAKFMFAKGAIMALTADMKMSLEEAKAFGFQWGVCCACGRTLTNAKSVELGIGPVCRKYF